MWRWVRLLNFWHSHFVLLRKQAGFEWIMAFFVEKPSSLNQTPILKPIFPRPQQSPTTSMIILNLYIFLQELKKCPCPSNQSTQSLYECASRFLMIYQSIRDQLFAKMHDLIDSESEQRLISPTAFIAGLEHPCNLPELNFDEEDLEQSELLFGKMSKSSVDQGTKGSQKIEKKRLAGLKSREKKKKQLGYLQASVKQLTAQIELYDFEISKCKDQLVQAIKISTNNSSEHAFTFAELQRVANCEDPDQDRINLLLDLIQNRIGANGKERQAKLQYNFKQIINSLFPAMHRYFMHAAVHHRDIFDEEVTPLTLTRDCPGKWTRNFYEEVQLSQEQIDRFHKMKGFFAEKRRETVRLISKLKYTKEQLKSQEEFFQRKMTQFREDMDPIQSAKLILFGERNRLRRQLSILCDEFAVKYPLEKKVKTE